MDQVMVRALAIAGGVGLLDSRTYGIVWADSKGVLIPPPNLRPQVENLFEYAEGQPEREFRVEWEGFAQAGYSPREIGALFSTVPPNVHLPCELQPFCKGIRGPYSARPMGS